MNLCLDGVLLIILLLLLLSGEDVLSENTTALN